MNHLAEQLNSQQPPISDPHFGPPLEPTTPFIEFTRAALEGSISDRFEQQVCQYSHKTALKAGKDQLTYTTLNQAANRIAHAILAKRGTQAEPVALMLEQGAWPVVAILGVLKAGKFYVPLDPAYPRARVSYILEDSGAPLIVTNNQNVALAQALAPDETQVINLDNLAATLSITDPALPISPETYAYLMYTSGSTGKPKGVIETHRNVLHHIMRLTNEFHICPEDRQTLLRSYSFNGSVRDILGTLLNGATLYPLNIEAEGTGQLAQWLIKEKITTYRSVVSVYRSFVNALVAPAPSAAGTNFPDLRLIHIGGESVNKRDVERFQRHFSNHCLLVNGFGITEVGTVRHFFMNKETKLGSLSKFGNTTGLQGSFVPVGYPSAEIEVLLLDEQGQPVGPNEIGEIVIRSGYMSPGYWRKPDLTRSKFLPDSQDSNKRLYLTGDLGRMLSDGCLIHLGRKDFQVKVRGHRIEVAEVEAALLDLESSGGLGPIREAYVMTQANKFGDHDLVAYLVPTSQARLNVTGLRRALTEVLPNYMIPSAFVVLDALPMTPTGKVDRRALPEPDPGRPELETPFVPPKEPLEKRLAEIWSDVLDLDKIGIHDNFFELGGQSLLATQIVSRVKDLLGVDLPLPVLFEEATIAKLAQIIEEILITEIENLTDDEVDQLQSSIHKAAKATKAAGATKAAEATKAPLPIDSN